VTAVVGALAGTAVLARVPVLALAGAAAPGHSPAASRPSVTVMASCRFMAPPRADHRPWACVRGGQAPGSTHHPPPGPDGPGAARGNVLDLVEKRFLN
jgi:hypothetical protein